LYNRSLTDGAPPVKPGADLSVRTPNFGKGEELSPYQQFLVGVGAYALAGIALAVKFGWLELIKAARAETGNT
jgi:hypothetical protein